MGTGGAYLASKKPGGMCKGPWTLPCIVIPVIIDEISDGGGEQPPPPDIEERAIDKAAALCIAQKNIKIKADNQKASQCIDNGGNEIGRASERVRGWREMSNPEYARE